MWRKFIINYIATHNTWCETLTYSIVAADPEKGDIGVAVASKFIAAGSIVPWVKVGVGGVATQAWANVRLGP
ncbi:MAG: DUF1028 domain-containing protein, partial [Desulfurococcales archaeon]|nr:DUF1028 domain-containing protein [Desulfurococcales archaeon]